jgi:asparagine synthase (glutamine-hydrolysing)
MGYSHSVEIRSPFLDHILVQFAFKIPSKFKIKNDNVKYILKMAMKNRLPKATLNKVKLGFPAPSYSWFADKDFNGFVRNIFEQSEIINKYFKKEKINYLFDNSHKFKESHQLFGLTSLAIWYENFFKNK